MFTIRWNEHRSLYKSSRITHHWFYTDKVLLWKRPDPESLKIMRYLDMDISNTWNIYIQYSVTWYIYLRCSTIAPFFYLISDLFSSIKIPFNKRLISLRKIKIRMESECYRKRVIWFISDKILEQTSIPINNRDSIQYISRKWKTRRINYIFRTKWLQQLIIQHCCLHIPAIISSKSMLRKGISTLFLLFLCQWASIRKKDRNSSLDTLGMIKKCLIEHPLI